MKFFNFFSFLKSNIYENQSQQNELSGKFECSNQFVLDLVGELYQPGHNLLFSPYSLTSALVMVLLGTDGNSRAQLVRAIFDKNDDGSKGDYYAKTFAEINKVIMDTNEETLKIANLLYAHKSSPLKPEYMSTLTEQLNAISKGLDFVGGNAKALKTINADVEKATNGLIKQLLNSIDPQTKVILVNTIYFKGVWSTEFDIDSTEEEGHFHSSSGTIVKTALMHKYCKYRFYCDRKTGVKAVELGYTNGNISMLAILPGEGVPIETYLKTQFPVGNSSLSYILDNLETDINVHLTLPRFKLAETHQFAGPLSSLGIRDIFESSSANLSRLSTNNSKDLFVSAVMQRAVIEVNEKGTEASALTSICTTTSVDRKRKLPRVEYFNANRPFFLHLSPKLAHQNRCFLSDCSRIQPKTSNKMR